MQGKPIAINMLHKLTHDLFDVMADHPELSFGKVVQGVVNHIILSQVREIGSSLKAKMILGQSTKSVRFVICSRVLFW